MRLPRVPLPWRSGLSLAGASLLLLCVAIRPTRPDNRLPTTTLVDSQGRTLGSLLRGVLLPALAAPAGFALLTAPSGGAQQAQPSARLLSAPERRVPVGAAFHDGMVIPHWEHGYLVVLQHETDKAGTPNVWFYDASGSQVRQATVWMPGAARVIITRASVAPDGDPVVAGFAYDSASAQAFFIARTDDTGKVVQTIQTNPYIPQQLCVAQDGTVWTAGGVRSTDAQVRNSGDIFRHYDFNRGLLGSYVPRSAFHSRLQPAMTGGPGREAYFACDADKLVLYSGMANVYVEINFSDASIRQWKVDRSTTSLPIWGFALTDSGDLYGSLFDLGSPSGGDGLYYLQHDDAVGTVAWTHVGVVAAGSSAMANFGPLFGAEGDMLVYAGKDDASTLYWATVSNAEAAKNN